jgi:hypothetical protein
MVRDRSASGLIRLSFAKPAPGIDLIGGDIAEGGAAIARRFPEDQRTSLNRPEFATGAGTR